MPLMYVDRFHRQAVVKVSGDPSGEMEMIAQALKGDAKNYHAWSYR